MPLPQVAIGSPVLVSVAPVASVVPSTVVVVPVPVLVVSGSAAVVPALPPDVLVSALDVESEPVSLVPLVVAEQFSRSSR